MSDPLGLAASLERRLELSVQRLERRLQERWRDPDELRVRQPLESVLTRLEALQGTPRLLDQLCDRELICVGHAVVLGYYTAIGELSSGTDEAKADAVESLEAGRILDHESSDALLKWCASRCRSDPV